MLISLKLGVRSCEDSEDEVAWAIVCGALTPKQLFIIDRELPRVKDNPTENP